MQHDKEIQIKKLSNLTQKEQIILQSKKELLQIEKNQELEKIRMMAQLEKQKILLQEEKKQIKFQQKIELSQQINNMELKRYFIIIIALLGLVSSFFIFYYFKKRREDKLQAYNDNLKKYFHQKENDARVKIAEKMLDTIASGNLSKSQENQLISALSGNENGKYQEKLSSYDADIEVVELIEDKK
jgi:hypothetical protein